VRFIIKHQQKNAPGQAVDGAFLTYDNETGQQILEAVRDHNAGQERVGMGILLGCICLTAKTRNSKRK
jgi:hypothetical protein